jgi:hypothetical protein
VVRSIVERELLSDKQMEPLLDTDFGDPYRSVHVVNSIARHARGFELQRKAIDYFEDRNFSSYTGNMMKFNKNLTADILDYVKEHSPGWSYKALQNPAFPASELKRFVHSTRENRLAIVGHPLASEELLRDLSDNDRDVKVRRAATKALAWHDPSSEHPDHVEVKFGTGKLRQIRDHIIGLGKESMSPKDLPPGDWKAGRDKSGNISAEKIQEYIDSLPAVKYGVSEGEWKGMQRHSKSPSYVFQLNLSTDQVRKLKDAGVWETFRKMHEASNRSGHPVGHAGLGWVRWTGDEKGIHVDEVQSDLGQSFVKQAAAQAKLQGLDVGETVDRAESEYPEEHYQKIKDVVFGGKHPSEVLMEAFLQHLRTGKEPNKTGYNRHTGTIVRYGGKQPMVGVPIHIWQPESKASISLGRSDVPVPGHFQVGYRDVPQKRLGMKPAKYGDLPTQTTKQHKGKATWGDTLRKREPGCYSNLGKVEE